MIPCLLLLTFLLGAVPAAAKDGLSLLTPQEADAVKASLKGKVPLPADLAAASDQALWEFVPPADLRRAVFLGPTDVGCPVHGLELFRVGGGFYPWKRSREKPWKVQCPVGGEFYPSNDFGAYFAAGRKEKLDTRQAYVDDGNGWVDDKGRRFFFVGHWAFWQRWYDVLNAIRAFTDAYFAEGDEAHAHRAAVLFCALAEQYQRMDLRTQGAQPDGGMILPWCWENQSVVIPLSECYDRLFPYLAKDGDPALREFLKGKTDLGPRKQIEQKFLQKVAKTNFTTDNYWSNECDHQVALATLALAWDNNDPADGITTRQMVEWILNDGGDNSLDELLFNSTYRDGFPCEGAIGYSQSIAGRLVQIAALMQRTGVNLYERFPRLKQVAGVWIDLTLADGHCASLGDAGGVLGSHRPWDAGMFHLAWENTHDPKFALALREMKSWQRTPASPDRQEEFERIARQHPEGLNHRTRNLGGMGLAILEAGDALHPRGLALYYGSPAGGHSHHDRLNIEYFDHHQPVLPDLGYPDQWGRKATEFTQNTIGHYGVLVDEKGEKDYMAGALEFLRGFDGVQVVSAHSERCFPGTGLYRRETALIDVSGAAGYVADIFRVRGGQQHDWSFHLPPVHDWSLEGADLSAPQKGTLAGEGVAPGDPMPAGRPANGFNWLANVQRGKPAGAFTFASGASAPFPRVLMTMLPGCAQEVMVGDHETPRIGQKLPPTMKWLLARNKGAGLSSAFAAVIEACPEAPAVQKVERLACAGGKEPVAMRVHLPRARDTILSDETGSAPVSVAGWGRFQGRWAFVREDGRGVARTAMVGAGLLRAGAVEVRTEPSWTGEITAIDFRRNCFDVSRALPAGAALRGEWLVIASGAHETSYQVERVEPLKAGSRVFLTEITPMVGKGSVARVDEAARTLHTDTRWRTFGKDYIWSNDFGPALAGYTLMNEDLSAAFEIAECKLMPSRARTWWKPEPAWIRLATGPPMAPALKDTDGDGKPSFWVYDFRVGSRVSLRNAVALERLSPGLWVVKHLGAPATVTLPAVMPLRRVMLRPAGEKVRPLPCRYDAKAKSVTFALPANTASPTVVALRESAGESAGPPVVRAIRVDGKAQTVSPAVDLNLAAMPAAIEVELEAGGSALDPESVAVLTETGALRAGEAGVRVSAGKDARTATVRVEPAHLWPATKRDVPTQYALEVVADDLAVDDRQARVTLKLLVSPQIPAGSVFLSDLEPVKAFAHAGVKRDTAYLGEPIRLGGAPYRKGLMVCPEVTGGATNYGEAVYALPAGVKTFRAVIGIEGHAAGGSVVFEVQLRKGDGEWRTAFRSGILGLNTPPQAVVVPLGDATQIRLYTDANGDIGCDHALFANARFER